MRVHDDARADAIARAHAADAVTLGADVYFRQGRLAPDDRRGEALLAHEASHVSASLGLPDAPRGRRPATRPGGARPGQGAGRAGRQPRRPGPAQAGRPVRSRRAGRARPPGLAGRHARRGRPRHRRRGRTGVDLEALRRSVVDDLMRRLKTEFERGG